MEPVGTTYISLVYDFLVVDNNRKDSMDFFLFNK